MYKLLTLVAVLALSGCATPKHYGASGGSKADGTIKMSYTYGMFEKPVVDESQALTQAIRRCKVWGYASAEAFDFVNRQCQSTDANGSCTSWLVTKEFQCNS